ncbi:hypothetical protein [Aeribacillus alveayuensis]|uniref:DUF5679 domain-containing protein n=1 Tax=Aeribacillus alveayuensis TaxID=279215 RepID=A0ABT9VLZ2_9BACI|nr:hypothetical protein [Bacillus alveayuensis]
MSEIKNVKGIFFSKGICECGSEIKINSKNLVDRENSYISQVPLICGNCGKKYNEIVKRKLSITDKVKMMIILGAISLLMLFVFYKLSLFIVTFYHR